MNVCPQFHVATSRCLLQSLCSLSVDIFGSLRTDGIAISYVKVALVKLTILRIIASI